jgi:hypothetical protein
MWKYKRQGTEKVPTHYFKFRNLHLLSSIGPLAAKWYWRVESSRVEQSSKRLRKVRNFRNIAEDATTAHLIFAAM